MQLQTKCTQLRIDWLMLLFPIIAAALGQGQETALLFLSLAAHETAHFLAARALNVSFHSLRLTPFGGMSQIDNPYSISALRLCAVSSAGPAANLLLMLISAALCHWRFLHIETASQMIHINALLMLFNLLPALPLDGGRMLYALLSTFMTRRRAMEIGVFLGRVLAAALLALTVWGCVRRGTLNLSPIFAALFLIISAEDERRALTDSRIRTLVDSLRPLSEPVEASIIAIDTSFPPESALRTVIPGRMTLFALFEDGRFVKLIDDRTLLTRILNADDKKSQQI